MTIKKHTILLESSEMKHVSTIQGFVPSVAININLKTVDGFSASSGIVVNSIKYCKVSENDAVPADEEFTEGSISNCVYYYSTTGGTPSLRTGLYSTLANLGQANIIYYKIKNEPGLSNYNGNIYIKFSLKELALGDVLDSSENSIIVTSNLAVKTTNPSFLHDFYSVPEYINQNSFYVLFNEDSNSNSDEPSDTASSDSLFFRYTTKSPSSSSYEWSQWEQTTIDEDSGKRKLVINLKDTDEQGEYVVKIIARDAYYNCGSTTDIAADSYGKSFLVNKYTVAPSDCEFNIYGQDRNSRYVGIKINSDGSFTPDRNVTIVFFGNSELPLTCKIDSVNDDFLIPDLSTDINNENPTVHVAEFQYKSTYIQDREREISQVNGIVEGADSNTSSIKSLRVTFTDVAGNSTVLSKSIILNNRIFLTEKKNLRETSSDYFPILMRENSNGTYDTISQVASDSGGDFKRAWESIYFPETHSPKMSNGVIDLAWARTAYAQYVAAGNTHTYTGSDLYDIINMTKDAQNIYQPDYDSEGREITKWNSYKTYGQFVSRNRADLWFKVIDNTEYGDITLNFERFDMSSTPGPMKNPSSGGYKGDVVMIYDAEDSACLNPRLNSDGTISYLVDEINTVLMTLLAVYTGSPGNVYDWLSGQSMNSDQSTGAFSETFQCSRICIIVCTDSTSQRSGFKIKAGEKIGITYSNYDIDEINGEVWYHGKTELVPWGSTSSKIRMFYDYYDAYVYFNYDLGRIIINSTDIPENSTVTADYSYYKHINDYNENDYEDSNSISRMYICSEDDFYDYLTVSAYVTPIGKTINKSGTLYNINSSGKFADSFWTVDKDRGLIEINRIEDVPFNQDENGNSYPMRITMDYVHHTFYRLTNDGYGNVNFEDRVIVADQTPIYNDVTWADIRIVNEGDAILESGILKFKCRGESTDGSDIPNKVLDVNRPWDVQEGIKEETFDKCRVYLSQTWNENYFQFSPTTTKLKETYTLATNNNTGAGLYVSLEAKTFSPRESLYGRIIWNLYGDNSYPQSGLTFGKKSWSCEVSGKYYILEY